MRRKRSHLAPTTNAPRKVLYVVLHGLISLVDVGDSGFIGYLLEMGDDHKYFYGNWLDEDEIPPRDAGQDPVRATIVGIDLMGQDVLNDDLNAVLKIKKPPLDTHPMVRAILQLPRPYQIHYRSQGHLEQNPFTGTTKDLAAMPTIISGVRVFEYNIMDENEVALAFDNGNVWRCPTPLVQRADLSLGVVHIYNEPHRQLTPDSSHNRLEFNASAKFFGSDLLFIKQTDHLIKNEDIPGLLEGDMRFLSMRGFEALKLIYHARGSSIDPDAGGEVGSGGGQVCGGLNAIVTAGVAKEQKMKKRRRYAIAK